VPLRHHFVPRIDPELGIADVLSGISALVQKVPFVDLQKSVGYLFLAGVDFFADIFRLDTDRLRPLKCGGNPSPFRVAAGPIAAIVSASCFSSFA